MLMSLVNVLCTPLSWVCALAAPVLQPVANVTDKTLWAIVAAVIFGAIWTALSFGDKAYCIEIQEETVEAEFKIQMTWIHGAFLVGFLGALSGDHHKMSFLGDTTVVSAEKMTLLNVMEWAPFAKVSLIAMVYGMILCGVLYAALKGPMGAVRVLSGFPFFLFLGKALMLVRIAVMAAVSRGGGLMFLVRGLVHAVAAFFDVIPVVLLPVLFVAMLMSKESMAAFNARQERAWSSPRHKKTAAQHAGYAKRDDGVSGLSFAVPTYVTDDEGNSYTVHYGAGFIYLDTPNGKFSTKWEYVKGSPWFDLGGKRFYPHF